MTQDEIIELVMQIGGCDRPEDDSPALKMFVTFAKLVAEKEREKVTKERECELASQRTWVGLTDEEKHEIRYSHMTSAEFIEFIEAKLKEKNK